MNQCNILVHVHKEGRVSKLMNNKTISQTNKTLTVNDNYDIYNAIYSDSLFGYVDFPVMMFWWVGAFTGYHGAWRDWLISSIRNAWAGKFKLNVGLIRSCESSYFARNLIRVFSMRCFNYPKEDRRLIYHRAMHSQVLIGPCIAKWFWGKWVADPRVN